MQEVEDVKLLPIAAWTDRDESELKDLIAESKLEILRTGRRGTAGLWTYLNFPNIELLSGQKFDIVHAVALGYPVPTRKPYVVTVHDIGPLTHPEYFSDTPPWLMEKALKQAVDKAAAFIAVSQSTADELQSYVQKKYKVDISPRLFKVLEGVSDSFFNPADLPQIEQAGEFNWNEIPFILAAGKISPRKNISTILRALALLRNKIDHHLVLVGGDGWDHESITVQLQELALEDRVHFFGYVSDEILKALYSKAQVFVYPSLYEGFGLTVLEAMASSCPVITSNSTSLPEVVQDAAITVNPKSEHEIAQAIELLCTKTEIRKDYISKGLKRAKELSWQKTARAVAEIYHKVYNGR